MFKLSMISVGVALALSCLVGCAGDEDHAPAVTAAADTANLAIDGDDANDPSERLDSPKHECRGGKRHHHGRGKNKFHHLDSIDGFEDGAITLDRLPDAVPAEMLAKLHKIDVNNDGVVTKEEARNAHHAWNAKHCSCDDDEHEHEHDGHGHDDDGHDDDGHGDDQPEPGPIVVN